jgi:hypothetical protein
MSGKKVIIGQSEWTIGEGAEGVVDQIKLALEKGTVEELALLDGAGNQVSVYLNGKVVETVVVDLGEGPRPSEMS